MEQFADESFSSLDVHDQDALLEVQQHLMRAEYSVASDLWNALSLQAKSSLLGRVQELEFFSRYFKFIEIYERSESLISDLIEAKSWALLRRAICVYVDATDNTVNSIEAIVYCSFLLKTLRERDTVDQTTEAYLLTLMASRYAELEDFSAVTKFQIRLNELLPEISEPRIRGAVHWTAANAHKAKGEYGLALAEYEQALQQYELAGNLDMQVVLQQVIGIMVSEQAHLFPCETQEYLSKIQLLLSTCSYETNPRMWVDLTSAHSWMLMNLGAWEKAYTQAYSLIPALDSLSHDMGAVQFIVAKCAWHLGNATESKSVLDDIQFYVGVSTMESHVRRTLRDVANLYAEMGEFERAYQALLMATSADSKLSKALETISPSTSIDVPQ